MNELQRQMYLSSLGIENYMPRMHLPFAPASIACDFPVVHTAEIVSPDHESVVITSSNHLSAKVNESLSINTVSAQASTSLVDMLVIEQPKKPVARANTAAEILALLADPFTLSIWRPFDGLMIIDSRNTKLALPTELLLQNLLHRINKDFAITLKEELLRWPMIENSFSKRSLQDARIELQTWLSVQHEIQPLTHLLLMGTNAGQYFVGEDINTLDTHFQKQLVEAARIKALILPSLNELLVSPLLKRSLYKTIFSYLHN
jgi:hypothetical protein